MSNELFIVASRKQYRFPTLKGGEMTVEQLWKLDLISERSDVVTLNNVAKTLNAEVKSFNEDTFVEEKSQQAKDAENKLEIVKFIIKVKQLDKELALAIKERRAAKEEVLEVLKEKKSEALKGLSVEQLEARVRELESAAGM